MLFLSSPAKTFYEDFKFPEFDYTQPYFLELANELVKNLQKQNLKKLQKTLEISEKLAKINYDRYQNWDLKNLSKNVIPAIFGYHGDVFRELNKKNYTKKNIQFAGQKIFIITGLYGILSAIDLIQPYRLEMKLSLDMNSKKTALKDYWQKKITDRINIIENNQVINLASKEYIQAVDIDNLQAKFVDVIFKQKNNKGKYQNIGILSKKARGKFLNWVINNQIQSLQKLEKFNIDGYKLVDKSEAQMIFVKD